jgi:hypothetical protein
VTFEDGRKGVIRATVKIRDMPRLPVERADAGGRRMNARVKHVELSRRDDGINQGDVMLKVTTSRCPLAA